MQWNLHWGDEKGVRELITALKVEIRTVSMPLREENRDKEEEREKERSACQTLSPPCSIAGVLNTAKCFKSRYGTARSAQRNDLYFLA